MMGYDGAIEATVSFTEAREEIERHGQVMADFVEDTGASAEYDGRAVLDWLGY